MNAKIKALGLIVIMFVTISIVFDEIVINLVAVKMPSLIRLAELHHKLVVSNDEEEIIKYLAESDKLFAGIEKDAESLYGTFEVIEILCMLNLTFFLQNVVNFLFTNIMGRLFQFPTVQQFSDLMLFGSSVVVIRWF